MNIQDLQERSSAASQLLTALSNPGRLMVLCHLQNGERSAGELARLVGLAPSAMSQHLARLRRLGLVTTRRQAQRVFYRLADVKAAIVIETLYGLYCEPAGGTAAVPSSPGDGTT